MKRLNILIFIFLLMAMQPIPFSNYQVPEDAGGGGPFQDFALVTSKIVGQGVDISADGEYIVIGDGGYSSQRGRFAVYKNDGGAWNQQIIINGTATNSQFAGAARITDDGEYIAIGSRGYNNFQGRVYMYKNDGGAWNAGPRIMGNTSSWFGDYVGFTRDGNYMASSESHLPGGGNVRVFRNDSNLWNEVVTLTKSIPGYTGNVEFDSSGTYLITGGQNGVDGWRYIWQKTGGEWTSNALIDETYIAGVNPNLSPHFGDGFNIVTYGGWTIDRVNYYTFDGTNKPSFVDFISGGTGTGFAVDITDDGRFMCVSATNSNASTLIYEYNEGAYVQVQDIPFGSDDCRMSEDGQLIVLGRSSGTSQIWKQGGP